MLNFQSLVGSWLKYDKLENDTFGFINPIKYDFVDIILLFLNPKNCSLASCRLLHGYTVLFSSYIIKK